MNPQTLIAKPTWPNTLAGCPTPARATRLLAVLLLLALPAVGRAQFNYTLTNGALTITGYPGPGGVVNIPPSLNGWPVTSIGDNAFNGCGSLTSVTIPGSVTNLGAHAFADCISLGDGVFVNCGLTAITVDALNPRYSSLGGVLFDTDQTLLIAYPAGQAGTYTIPSGVTNLGANAFTGSALGRTPTGFHNLAQGCAAGSTLGMVPQVIRLPQGGCGLRAFEECRFLVHSEPYDCGHND